MPKPSPADPARHSSARASRPRSSGVTVPIAAVALVAAALVPWTDLQDHPHWENVGWIPFRSWPVSAFDIVANVALFMPLGAAVASRARHRPLLAAAAAAAALSLAGEGLQLYSHTRFPSATDLVANVSGAVIAAFLVRRSRAA